MSEPEQSRPAETAQNHALDHPHEAPTAKSEPVELWDAQPDRPADNPSVSRCIRAWNRAYREVCKELRIRKDDCDFDARQKARNCFLRAMPPLAGYENIRDFIACIAYSQVLEVLNPSEAESYLAAAKLALAALRRET